MKTELNPDVLVRAMTAYYADKRLQAVIIGKMAGLKTAGSDSAGQISYCENLQSQILEICKGKTANITVALRELLLEMNFNTRGFIAYCKSDIDATLEGHCTEDEKFEYLYALERKFKTLICNNKGITFEPLLPKLKDAILKHVKAEISFMKKKRGLFIENTWQSAELQALSERLDMRISVEVLAFFFRLLLEVGVVGSSRARLLEFLSRNFCTPKTRGKHLSASSVESKYRQVAQSTASTVRAILKKMLKLVEETYG